MIEFVLSAAAIPFALAQIAVALELWASLFPARKRFALSEVRPPCVVLIPAHDEASGIAATLQTVRPQLIERDRLLVIADNCTDRTADIARALGAEVWERNDRERSGKGHALAFARAKLGEGTESLVLLDADCRLEAGALEALVRQAHRTQAPAQAIYRLEAGGAAHAEAASIAFRVRNEVRAIGLDRLAGVAHLQGSGMAIPRLLFSRLAFLPHHLAEDRAFGIECALAGHAPRLCEDAIVTGSTAPGTSSQVVQLRRWIHGNLSLFAYVPRLVAAAVRRRDSRLLWLALDVSIPPLSLLFVGSPILLAGSFFCSPAGFGSLAVSWLAFGPGVVISWRARERTLPSVRVLRAIARRWLRATSLSVSAIARRERDWIRTPRVEGFSS